MKCEYCLNEDRRFFYQGAHGWICRKCIHFGGKQADSFFEIYDEASVEPHLNFELTVYQQRIAQQLIKALAESDVVLEAVCGAGKTEMVLEVIRHHLLGGMRIGWAIARRQVVLELRERLAAIFPGLKVIAVCEGHTNDLRGDLVLCTTHQLYRYRGQFDLLILDEADAYPFADDVVLNGIARTSCRGRLLYMSATMNKTLLRLVKSGQCKTLYLPLRPSLRPLNIPTVILRFRWLCFLELLRQLRQIEESCLIFVGSIAQCIQLSRRLRCDCLHSRSKSKEEIIADFRRGKRTRLVATTILERGVTFSDISVIVYGCEQEVFSPSVLIQIAGRVQRGLSVKGQCIFIGSRYSTGVARCIKNLRRANVAGKKLIAKTST